MTELHKFRGVRGLDAATWANALSVVYYRDRVAVIDDESGRWLFGATVSLHRVIGVNIDWPELLISESMMDSEVFGAECFGTEGWHTLREDSFPAEYFNASRERLEVLCLLEEAISNWERGDISVPLRETASGDVTTSESFSNFCKFFDRRKEIEEILGTAPQGPFKDCPLRELVSEAERVKAEAEAAAKAKAEAETYDEVVKPRRTKRRTAPKREAAPKAPKAPKDSDSSQESFEW